MSDNKTTILEESGITNKTLIEWAFRLISLTLIPLVIWAGSLLIKLDKDVAILKSNQFTAQDGFDLTQQMVEMERNIRADTPPKEWKDRVIELESCVRNLELGRVCY